MNKELELELEAEKLRQNQYIDGSITTWTKNDWQSCWKEGFIAGATSDAAKKYWYEKLKNYLSNEYENHSSIPDKNVLSDEQYLFKIISDTGIRVFIKQLEQKLKEYE